MTGSVNFDKVILGLIFSAANLDSSDYLGAVGTVYPTGIGVRGFDGAAETGTDDYSVDVTGKVLTVTMETLRRFDQVRVITEADAVIPEPGTLALLGLGLAGLGGMARSRRRV